MIQLFHVFKVFPGDSPALSDVSLHIGKGEFVFLTGSSGAGKTTLLKLLFCAEKPSQGQVLIDGCNVAGLRRSGIPALRRKIGVVFQDFKLLPERTVFENVALTLDVLGVPQGKCEQEVRRILHRVGLDHKRSCLPSGLSGGEQQRVVIARAMVNNPLLLLADEPTGNLDPALTLEIMDLLCAANAQGTTVVVATHDPNLLAHYPKRILQLERGSLVLDSQKAGFASRMATG